MMLPNQCSYCAHQRIHAHKSPYCCPECGAVCRSAYFQTHVKENCLHYSRKVGFRCVQLRLPGRLGFTPLQFGCVVRLWLSLSRLCSLPACFVCLLGGETHTCTKRISLN